MSHHDSSGEHSLQQPGVDLYSLDGITLVLVLPQSQSETESRRTETEAVRKTTYRQVRDGEKDKEVGHHKPSRTCPPEITVTSQSARPARA